MSTRKRKGVYVIKRKADNLALYIGQSLEINRRWKQHQNKYPVSKHYCRIIWSSPTATSAELDACEQYYIRKFGKINEKYGHILDNTAHNPRQQDLKREHQKMGEGIMSILDEALRQLS